MTSMPNNPGRIQTKRKTGSERARRFASRSGVLASLCILTFQNINFELERLPGFC
jgi:hypothetical protein